VHPGVADGTAGTLIIMGNYSQEVNGVLVIELTGPGPGGVGILDVTFNAAGRGPGGGTIAMNNTTTDTPLILFVRAPGFNPGAMSAVFLDFQSFNGTFSWASNPQPDTWFDGAGSQRQFQAPSFTPNTGSLNIW
jgi:hypothetical protein